jgi:CxxC motif-containing protein (DUF1111 family)
MKLLRHVLSMGMLFVYGVLILMAIASCDSSGNLTETVDTVSTRDLSGIAGPPTGTPTPVDFVPRAQFATDNTAAALSFPNLNADELGVFQAGLALFITDRTPADGLGPIFNQRICLGCHTSTGTGQSTPAGRATRAAPTDLALTKDPAVMLPPTEAFTLFGDFSPASGAFNPLSEFGGPVQQVRATPPCKGDVIPDESIDPNLAGGIDPITGLSALGMRRELGERAGPPYIGRGLMEAIFAGDIVANQDPQDTQGHNSSLADPSVTNPECPSDCVSGRPNMNSAAGAFVGGDPVIRVARFGLRAAGPTLLQFIVGGSQGEVGLTSPFSPFEQNNNQNVGLNCDQAPDPELTAEDILNLRTMIRLVAPPEFDPCLLENPPVTAVCSSGGSAVSIQNGAALFGVDIAAFQDRMTNTNLPDGLDDHAINQADRMLNCVGCHIPIMTTGQSPAAIGARLLSNKWVPLFSDLLLHDMGEIPRSLTNPLVPPSPVSLEIRRSLADFALPGQGLASGREWRTPPLMGIGVIGPPFMHDARVFVNLAAPATTVTSNSGGMNLPLTVDSVDNAFLAAIELHDLPENAAGCPQPSPPNDTCPVAGSGNRSEARNVMARWRALTTLDQQDVINFLKAL